MPRVTMIDRRWLSMTAEVALLIGSFIFVVYAVQTPRSTGTPDAFSHESGYRGLPTNAIVVGPDVKEQPPTYPTIVRPARQPL